MSQTIGSNVMYLSEIFEYLSTGEMADSSLGEELVCRGITPDTIKKVIPNINLGLNEIFTKLHLLDQEVIIQLHEHMTDYHIHSKYSMMSTDPLVIYKYVMDSPSIPFTDNIVKILSVHNEEGQPLYLDDSSEAWAVALPAYNILQCPYPTNENSLLIKYQATLPKIKYTDGIDITTLDINLPNSVLNLLLFFIGSRINMGMNNQETMAEANFFKAKYLEELNAVRNGQYQNNNNYIQDIQDEGWV